jgi:glycosyltransferase involved in cell wall biosynthesis
MIKVSFLTGEFPPMQGGIADHIVHLANHMAILEIDSSILTSRRWQETASGDIGSSATTVATWRHHVFPVLPNWGWRCWPATATFTAKHQPDIVHIQYQAAAFDLGGWVNWLPWYLKKRRIRTQIVTTFHDLRIPYIFPKAGPARQKSILALARHSDGVICTNREDLQTLTDQLGDTGGQSSSPQLTHIPLGSNVEPQPPADFNRQAWRTRYQAGEDTLLLAYFGFLNESKGGEELVGALARLRQEHIEARLLLIGGDVGHADPTNRAYAQSVQTLINNCGLTAYVYRTGYISLAEVSANLLAADAVVMPYRDGVSFRRTTLIAALRHGCPVVSTRPADLALIPEIRPGQNMLLAPPEDAEALAGEITSLAQNTALRAALSTGAKSLGRLFEWEKIAAQTAELYRQLIPSGN